MLRIVLIDIKLLNGNFATFANTQILLHHKIEIFRATSIKSTFPQPRRTRISLGDIEIFSFTPVVLRIMTNSTVAIRRRVTDEIRCHLKSQGGIEI